MINIIKRTLQGNQRDWHAKLKIALWVDRIIPKKVIENSDYMLVYGKEAKLPISTKLPALDIASQLVLFEHTDSLALRYT